MQGAMAKETGVGERVEGGKEEEGEKIPLSLS